MGETGVFIVRLFYFGLGGFFVYWIFKVYTNNKKNLLLIFTQRGLEVSDDDITIIEWKNIGGFKLKTLSGRFKKEIHKIIIFPKNEYQGKIVKIDIYCSGLETNRFKEIVKSFSSGLENKIA